MMDEEKAKVVEWEQRLEDERERDVSGIEEAGNRMHKP